MEPQYLINHEINNIIAWQHHQVPPPVVVNIRLTKRCNLRCVFCEKSIFEEYSEELSEKKLAEIVKEAAHMRVKELNLDGSGENFTRKKTAIAIMKLAKAHNIRGFFVSNGTLLNTKDIQEIIAIGWDRVNISLDGPDAKTHDFLRGKKGAFNKTINTLKLFQYYKHKSNKKKPNITVATVLTNKNYTKIHEILRLMHTLEVKNFRLQVLQKRTPATSKLKLNSTQEHEFISSLKNTERSAVKMNIHNNLAFFYEQSMMQRSFRMGEILKKEVKTLKKGLWSAYCLIPWWYIGVRENGVVEPCPGSDFRKENSMNTSLHDIWTGDLYSNVRDKIMEKKFFSFCDTCCGSQIFDIQQLKQELMKQSKDA